jgi:hypothetical protein
MNKEITSNNYFAKHTVSLQIIVLPEDEKKSPIFEMLFKILYF